MSDNPEWLGLWDEHGEHFMVNLRGAWRILSRSDIGDEIVMQVENVADPERTASVIATKIPGEAVETTKFEVRLEELRQRFAEYVAATQDSTWEVPWEAFDDEPYRVFDAVKNLLEAAS